MVAIGGSGGSGLRDIQALLQALPCPTPAAILAVLHHPVDRIGHLRDILARAPPIPVRVAGPRMTGVVLSGSLDDGSRGLAAIHHAGGTTMVLDPDGSAFPGTPRNAMSFDGPVSLVGTATEIAAGIGRLLAGMGQGRP